MLDKFLLGFTLYPLTPNYHPIDGDFAVSFQVVHEGYDSGPLPCFLSNHVCACGSVWCGNQKLIYHQ